MHRTHEKDIQKDPVADARAYFAGLQPLQSFADVDSEGYVRALRGKSHILRKGARKDAAHDAAAPAAGYQFGD